MEIKVLGPGCPKCQQTERVVRDVIDEAGLSAEIKKITDVMEISDHGVFGTPAVMVDGEVKSVGRVPSKEDVQLWINT